MSEGDFANEKAFMRWVLKEARARGWRAAHLSNMQVVRQPPTTPGGKPITRAVPDRNAAGFPDLVLVHPTHGLVWAELKREKTYLDIEQKAWLHDLRVAGQRVYVWRPHDADEIVALLETGQPLQGSIEEATT